MIWSTMFILRGLPGSGKSTLANKIVKSWNDDIYVVSADHYFTRTGKYIFDPQQLPQAHQACLEKCKRLLSRSRRYTIVIDNTNSQRWEYAPYLQLAQLHEVAVVILEIPCPDEPTLLHFHRRNIHRVPMKAMLRMRQNWQADPRAVIIQEAQDLYDILAALR